MINEVLGIRVCSAGGGDGQYIILQVFFMILTVDVRI